MNEYFNKINELGGLIITFSYSVFESGSLNSKLNNYFLFSELKDLFLNYSEKRLLAEWVFELSNYDLNVFNNELNYISYIDDKNFKIVENENILKIKNYLNAESKKKKIDIIKKKEIKNNLLIEFSSSDPIKINNINKLS